MLALPYSEFKLLPAPTLTQITTEDGRYYHDASGNRYYSVTTVLKKSKTLSPAIKRWQKKVAAYSPEECAKQIIAYVRDGRLAMETAKQAIDENWSIQQVTQAMMTAGSKRGTSLHKMIEDYFDLGHEGTGEYWKSIRPFLDRVTARPICKEYFVHHPVLKYAGSLDMCAEINFSVALLDWKTADKEKQDDWIEDYFLQVAAYAAALRCTQGLRIENAYIVIAIPYRPAQVFHMDLKLLVHFWAKFQDRLRVFKSRIEIAE